MNWINNKQTARAALFLLPFFLYEDSLLAGFLFVTGMWLMHIEKISLTLQRLEWREYIFYIYMFHMLYGERTFAYLGFEPIFVTEVVLFILAVSWHRELLQIHKNLFIYYLLVLIGLLWAAAYLYEYRVNALRDSLMLVYAIWVPIVYHVFSKRRGYDLFFNLLKLFIVFKAGAYVYESAMILLGYRTIVFEGFRFGVGYAVPALIVISLFIPFRYLDMKYKLLSFMMLPAVFTMFHRSIFFGITLAVLLLYGIGRTKVKKTILVYSVTSLLFLLGFLFYYNTQVNVNMFTIIQEKVSTDEGNINFRFQSWDVVLDKFKENYLLGYGVGRPVMFVQSNMFYDTIDLDYFDVRDLGGNAQPHNSYLNILTRFGIFIFPLLLYALWKPFSRLIYLFRFQKVSFASGNRLLLLGGLLVLMYTFAFFNVVLESPHHSFPFWLAVGMVLCYGRKRNSMERTIRLRKQE